MASGYANVKLRPIKFAFLVPYNDNASLLKAIKLNTFLWGGVYNPIIPIYKSVPRNFPKHLKEHIRDKDYFQRYLDTFSPDFIVRLGDCANQDFDKDKSENISASDIFIGFETSRVPHYGIGLFEVLNHFASNEYKYLQRNPKKLCVPRFSGRYSIFLSSIFGQLSDEINEIFIKDYFSHFENENPECSINTYTELLNPEKLFLRRLTAYQINQTGNTPCILYLDASKFIDIVDYWNLRALGFNVLPVAKQAVNSILLRQHVVDFIEQNYRPSQYPNITFYESSSINTFDFESEKLLKGLRVPFRCPVRENEIPKDKVHLSYLPLLDDWSFNNSIKSRIKSPMVKEARVNIANDTGQVKLLSPEFMFPTIRRVAFANDIELTTHQNEKLMAEVIPEGNNLVAICIGGIDFPEWRVRKGKFTYLSHFSDWTFQLKLPLAEEVFFRWFQNSEFSISISQAGRIAKQMLKSLGGISGLWLLAEKEIFDLIYNKFRYKTIRVIEKVEKSEETKVTETEKEIDESKVIEFDKLLGKIKKISNESKSHRHRDSDILLRNLLKSEIIQLGLKVNCTFCNQPSWYSLDEFGYEVKCIKCWETSKIPTYSPNNQLRWAYRTIGAFSPATEHYGSYAVLLALRFFSINLRGATTPIFGLNIKLKTSEVSLGETPDADLALFFREDFSQTKKPDLVFVECKTYNNRFVEKDIKNMTFLAKNFPSAYFVFATLENEFKIYEKELIKNFVENLKQLHKKDEVKIVILTGTELYSEKSPPDCWKEKTEIDLNSLSAKFINNKLSALSESSQKIYLS